MEEDSAIRSTQVCTGGGPPPPAQTESGGALDGCSDGIDNDGDGLTDSEDDDCGGGTPVGTFPGGGAGAPLLGSSPTDNNPVDQIGSRRAVARRCR